MARRVTSRYSNLRIGTLTLNGTVFLKKYLTHLHPVGHFSVCRWKNCKAIVGVARTIRDGILKIPGLRIEGSVDSSVVAWASDVFDVNLMVDPLTKEKGWDLNVLQFPPCIHIGVTNAHTIRYFDSFSIPLT